MLTYSFLLRLCLALLLIQPSLVWAECKHNESNVKKLSTAQVSATAHTNSKIKQVNITILKQRLRKTAAIGFFTKLALRNDLVDLTDEIKKYRRKSILSDKLKEIRASFDGLLLKLIALLDNDPDLSRDLYVGREMIWQSLLEEKA
ncbi:hypothetical protein JYT48_00180 [Mariprofundus ferrooxydans]|nr:hypothetical protein [Mariprofundus ferrooxydans]